jgi:hypothetical protein
MTGVHSDLDRIVHGNSRDFVAQALLPVLD